MNSLIFLSYFDTNTKLDCHQLVWTLADKVNKRVAGFQKPLSRDMGKLKVVAFQSPTLPASGILKSNCMSTMDRTGSLKEGCRQKRKSELMAR